MRKATWSTVLGVVMVCAVTVPAGAATPMTAEISNGVPSSLLPTVGFLIGPQGLCSGTLIGCSTFLTAAHCICGEGLAGSECRARADLIDPTVQTIFFQHAGFVGVDKVEVHPQYSFGSQSDLAVLHLSSPVTGIRPSPLNSLSKPAAGTSALIAGFGTIPEYNLPSGLKQAGLVTVASCKLANPATHICWDFVAPIGPVGEDSSTCHGDSGGPLFVQQGNNLVLAGVTSGGFPTCLPPDSPFDADVFRDLSWIQSVAGSIGTASCGATLRPVEEAPTTVYGAVDLSDGATGLGYTLTVPSGSPQLRVAMNALGAFNTDYDLYVRRNAPPTTTNYDCSSVLPASLEYCQISNPQPGTWYVLLVPYSNIPTIVQTTATVFAQRSSQGTCDAGADAIYLLNGRFRVDACWRTSNGSTGTGKLATVSGTGATMWFFNSNNPELFVKVRNACVNPFNRYWFFAAGLTNVEVTITVTDTQADVSKTYKNPLNSAFESVQDTDTFATCP